MNNASQFKYNYFNNTIQRILQLIIHSYHLISENESFEYTEVTDKRGYKTYYVLNNNLKEKPEEYIRNLFLSEKYMWNKRLMRKYRIKRLSFEAEPAETDESNMTIGFHDIKVLGLTNEFDETEKGLYFSIECKRLNKSGQDSIKYINHGIRRYVIGQYSNKMPVAGMIAFIEDGNPIEYKEEINVQLENNVEIETINQLNFNLFHTNFYTSYISEHKRQNSKFETILLHHLFFEIGHIIIKKKHQNE